MSDIKRSISLYSYQDEYYAGLLDLEGCLRETAKTGATGVELLAEQMIRNFPNPIEDEAFRENWFAMLEKYGLTPSCYDAFLESRLFANRTMSLTEQVNMMKRDLRCAKLLGFPVIRTLVSTPMDVIEGSLDYAEKVGVKIGLEVHAPFSLNSGWADGYLEMIHRTGTRYFGFIPDMGIFCRNIPDVVADKAYADFTDHAANFMIDKGEQLEKIDVNRADVFYNYGNITDDDGDGCVDEEVIDGFDNDGDGEVDEDPRSQAVNVTDMNSIQYTTNIIYPPVKELKMVGRYESGDVDIDMNGLAGDNDPDEWTFKNKDYSVRFNNGDHLLKFAFKADFFSPYFMNLSPEERIEIKDAVRHDTNPNNIQYSLQQRQQLIGGCWNNYDETRFRLWIMSRNAL